MFCPKCKAEYREGFFKCADCGIDLIPELTQEQEEELLPINFVEVYSTYKQSEIAFVKSILDGEGITYYFQGDSAILISYAGAYARLFVAAEDAQQVRELLSELELSEPGSENN
jgi:hypothetical protein